MKLPTTYNTDGFLVIEILVSISLLVFFMLAISLTQASALSFRKSGLGALSDIGFSHENQASTTLSLQYFGNHTTERVLSQILLAESNHTNAWGRESCVIDTEFKPQSLSITSRVIDLGQGITTTDIEVRNSIVYITADSSSAMHHDFFIIDFTDHLHPHLLSSINTGPGLSALDVAGPYIYAANLGSTNQLQVIDISDRRNPIVVSKLKLPLPHASSTAPIATSIFYHRGHVYLGTAKWEGVEFAIIDVTNPVEPIYRGGYHTDTKLNSLLVEKGTAYAAASDVGQVRMINVEAASSPVQILQFSPSGWETQQGRAISLFENRLLVGRNTGGFNVLSNHELFDLSHDLSPQISKDVPGGVYGIVQTKKQVLTITHNLGKEFQVRNTALEVTREHGLGFEPTAIRCDHNDLYFATGDRWGVAVLKNAL